jgi:hypothetical protein
VQLVDVEPGGIVLVVDLERDAALAELEAVQAAGEELSAVEPAAQPLADVGAPNFDAVHERLVAPNFLRGHAPAVRELER